LPVFWKINMLKTVSSQPASGRSQDMRRVICPGTMCRFFMLLMVGLRLASATAGDLEIPTRLELLTNLFQLRHEAGQEPQVLHPFRIVADVVDADAVNGVLALRDASGVEFIRVAFSDPGIKPGARVCLEGDGCGLKKEGFGLLIIPGMVVDCDGIHASKSRSGRVFLQAGTHPITVRWFDWFGAFGLSVDYEGPDIPRQAIPGSALSRMSLDRATGRTNYSAGLDYRCCEGVWESLPDFQKLQPVRTGIATNINLSARTRDGAVGLEFTGFLAVPKDGVYTFYVASDDGSQLSIGDASVSLRVLSSNPAPVAAEKVPASVQERAGFPWVALNGTVTAAGIWDKGGELLMRVGSDDVRVEIFESGDYRPGNPLQGKMQVSGIYQDSVAEDGGAGSGRLLVLNCKAIRPVAPSEFPTSTVPGGRGTSRSPTSVGDSTAGAPPVISTMAEIKALSTEQSKEKLPVTIRGVVTACMSASAVVQDSTKGVYVELQDLPEVEPLRRGEFCQIEGVTGPGWFAPVVVAHRIIHLGPGQMPKPLPTTWDQLMNGSLDSEYAEVVGVVTAVSGRRLVLLTKRGKITLELIECRPQTLVGYQGALVRIQGCVLVNFDAESHKLGVGSLIVHGAVIEVLQPAPRDSFDAPRKSLGELLLYDPKAATFRMLKVSGQIIYGRPGEYYLTDGTNGMHVTTRNTDLFAVGDQVDAVGYLELGGPAAELREAVMRRTGSDVLHPPTKIAQDQLLQASHADTLVQMEATLMNQWHERSESVLELQAGFLVFKARLVGGERLVHLPPLGSRLELTGVYVPQGNGGVDATTFSSFELLLPSPKAVRILATPPWWTMRRVFVLAGILVVLLCAALVWNNQLQRQVQERGRKLEAEIRHRQRAELQHAAEAERARIARDLHDELGTGLTEVSLLAGTGSRESLEAEKSNDRFRAIAEKARALVSNLDVIVWAIDPRRNSLQSFADYLGRYATELFSATDIVCRFMIPIECNAVTFSESARHSLFLAVKEALNNVIRHSGATEVELRIEQTEDCLQVVIADNGCGFDWNTIRRGNGLTNIRERLEALKGGCRIESQTGQGSIVKLTVPLPRGSG
jgi:signal transduction histidine kinase